MVLVGGCTGVTSDVGAPSTYLVFGIFYQDMIFAIPVIANKYKPYTGSLWNSKECNACKFWWVCSITSCVCRSLGLRNQDELLKFGTYGACCILLEIKSVFLQTSFFSEFGDYLCAFRIFQSFRAFIYMFWDINLKLDIYIMKVASRVKFEFHFNRDTLTYFTAKNRSK